MSLITKSFFVERRRKKWEKHLVYFIRTKKQSILMETTIKFGWIHLTLISLNMPDFASNVFRIPNPLLEKPKVLAELKQLLVRHLKSSSTFKNRIFFNGQEWSDETVKTTKTASTSHHNCNIHCGE